MLTMNRKPPIISGRHTTLIEIAKILVAKGAMRDKYTTRVNPGIIRPTYHSAGGKFRVKFTDINGGIKMTVRGNMSVQDVQIFTDNITATRDTITRAALARGYIVAFGHSKQNIRK